MKLFSACLMLLLGINLFSSNLIKNGDFSEFTSEGPLHWINTYKSTLPGKFNMDKNVFISAPAALCMENPKKNCRVRFEQPLSGTPSKEYIFSFYIKGNNITGQNGARAIVTDENDKWITGGSLDGLWKQKTGSFDWEKCEFKFTSPGNGKLKVILSLHDAQGTAWFDDVSITEVNNTKTTNDQFPVTGHLFPVIFQKGPYAICDNIPGMLFLNIEGQSNMLLENGLKIEFILPPELYLVGVSPNFPYDVSGKNYSASVAENVFLESENHYIVDINTNILKKIKQEGFSWGNYERIFIGAKQGNTGKQVSVRWRLHSGNKKGLEQNFQVKIIPPIDLNNTNCKLFRTLIMYPKAQSAPFPEVVDSYEKFWTSLTTQAGAGTLLNMKNSSGEVRNRFLKKFSPAVFFTTELLFRNPNILKDFKSKMPSAIYSDGKAGTMPSEIETYYLIEDPDGILWDKEFPRLIKATTNGQYKPEMILFDYEPLMYKDSGFSAENRDRFAKYTNRSGTPSIQEIQTKYNKQWIDFRRYQHSLVVKKFCEATHRYFPGVKAVLATDVLRAEGDFLSTWCITDPRLSDNDVDFFMNMPYYTGLKFYNDIELNNKLLKKKNFPFIDPAENIKSFFEKYTGPKIKQNIIAAAALGCTGIAFWPSDCMDADYLSSIAKGFFAVSIAEDCYFVGSRCNNNPETKAVNVFSQTINDDGKQCVINYPNFEKNLKLLIHQNNDEYVITALNYDSQNQAIVKALIPEFKARDFQVADAVSLKGFNLTTEKIKTGFLFPVPPDGAAVIKIGKIKFNPNGIVSQEELEKERLLSLDKFQKESSFKTLEKDSSKILWTTMPGKDDTPVLKLQNNNGKAYIDTNNGANIVAWFNSSNNNPLRYKQDCGFLGDFVLYDTAQAVSPYKFALAEININENSPEASFSYTVPAFEGANPEPNPLEGLVVNKKIALSNCGNCIKIDFTLTNKAPHKNAMTFGFRVRNLPYLGASFSGLTAPVEISSLLLSENNEVKPASHIMFLRPGCKLDFMPNIERKPWNGNAVSAVARNGALQEILKFEASQTAGFFVWRASNLYTVELLSNMITLPYDVSYNWSLKINIEK